MPYAMNASGGTSVREGEIRYTISRALNHGIKIAFMHGDSRLGHFTRVLGLHVSRVMAISFRSWCLPEQSTYSSAFVGLLESS